MLFGNYSTFACNTSNFHTIGCNLKAWNTIVANCAYYLFLGSRDLQGCQDIAKRMNVPLDKVLYKDRNEVFILSDFHRPLVDTVYDVRTHPRYDTIEND